jgi:G3E family GTPase
VWVRGEETDQRAPTGPRSAGAALILVASTRRRRGIRCRQMMLNNPLLSHFVRLDAVVTTVDAVNAPRQLDEHPEAVKQVAIADRLLLTETDLSDAASVSAIENHLSRINPGAAVIVAAYGDVPPDRLFGAALFDPAHKTPDVQAWLRPERHEHHDGTHGDNDRGIRSFCLTFDDPLPCPAVSNWLMMLRQWGGRRPVAREGDFALAGGRATGGHSRRSSCVSSAGAVEFLARRRSAIPHRVHYARP